MKKHVLFALALVCSATLLNANPKDAVIETLDNPIGRDDYFEVNYYRTAQEAKTVAEKIQNAKALVKKARENNDYWQAGAYGMGRGFAWIVATTGLGTLAGSLFINHKRAHENADKLAVGAGIGFCVGVLAATIDQTICRAKINYGYKREVFLAKRLQELELAPK